MNIACLDGDISLDPPINNLAAPARVFEDSLCRGNSLRLIIDFAGPAVQAPKALSCFRTLPAESTAAKHQHQILRPGLWQSLLSKL